MKDTNLQRAAEAISEKSFRDSDIVLTDDLRQLPVPRQTLRMTFIIAALCLEGEAGVVLDDEDVTIRPGELILISDRHLISGLHYTDNARCLCVMMSVGFYYDVLKNIQDMSTLFLFSRSHPVVGLSAAETEMFAQYFYQLQRKTAEQDNHFRREISGAIMLAIIYDLSAIVYRLGHNTESRNRSCDLIFSRFIHLVEENYKERHHVAWYAAELNITSKYLAVCVSKASNYTPADWINRYLLVELRLLLRASEMSLKEISDETCFSSQSQMGKFFKDNVGLTPKEYRRSRGAIPIRN